jgi:hypothetical protein
MPSNGGSSLDDPPLNVAGLEAAKITTVATAMHEIWTVDDDSDDDSDMEVCCVGHVCINFRTLLRSLVFLAPPCRLGELHRQLPWKQQAPQRVSTDSF